jgi:hypothetical protein
LAAGDLEEEGPGLRGRVATTVVVVVGVWRAVSGSYGVAVEEPWVLTCGSSACSIVGREDNGRYVRVWAKRRRECWGLGPGQGRKRV